VTDYLNKEEVQKVLLAAAERGARDEILVRLLAFSGARIGEIVPLTCGDVDPVRGSINLSKVIILPAHLNPKYKPHGKFAFDQKKEITFLEEGPTGYTGKKISLTPTKAFERFYHIEGELVKSGLKASQPTRVIPLSDSTLRNTLIEWTKGRGSRDFLLPSNKGGRLTKTQCYRIVADTLLAAGVEKHKAHPHILRHSWAVNSLKQGVDLVTVQRILGHTKIEMTAKYLRLVYEDLKDKVDKAGPIY